MHDDFYHIVHITLSFKYINTHVIKHDVALFAYLTIKYNLQTLFRKSKQLKFTVTLQTVLCQQNQFIILKLRISLNHSINVCITLIRGIQLCTSIRQTSQYNSRGKVKTLYTSETPMHRSYKSTRGMLIFCV